LADRVRLVAGLLAFATLLACGPKVNSAASQPAATPSLAASANAAARALARYYQAENQAATDAYVERAAARGAPVARVEPCRLASGALSRRPTALANPPLERAAIEQRESLFAGLQAYSSALDAIATAGGGAAPDLAVAGLRRRTADLVRAANDHGRSGDLFIEDDAATLAGDVARLGSARDPAGMRRALEATDPTIRALIAILADDFALQRRATIDATALAYARWRARVAPGRGAAQGPERAWPPFCSEPATAAGPDERVADSQTVDTAAPASVRGAQLYRRMDAGRRVDLSPVLEAMMTFDQERLLALREPANASAAAAALAARERLTTELHDFARSAAEGAAP